MTFSSLRSMIDRLTPKQRIPGSGATSDKEMAVFKSALPSLINTPGGNKMILDVMKALAQDRIERADIANKTFEDMSPQEAFEALRERVSPLGEVPGLQRSGGSPGEVLRDD